MSRRLLAVGFPAAALAAAFAIPPSALAAEPVQLSTLIPSDVSADGSAVLLADESVIDGTDGTTITPAGSDDLVALSDGGSAALVKLGSGFVVRTSTGDQPFAFAPDGSAVGVGGRQPLLVRDGAGVIFQTDEPTPRILERDLANGTTTVRMSDAELLGATADGSVVTWRQVGDERFLAEGSSVGLPFTSVGYQIRGGEPRIVRTSVTTTDPAGTEVRSSELPADAVIRRQPLDLLVGGTAGSAALYLEQAPYDEPYVQREWLRTDASGAFERIADSDGFLENDNVRVNRADASYAVTTVTDYLGPGGARVRIARDQSAFWNVTVPAPPGNPDGYSLPGTAYSFANGRTGIYWTRDQSGDFANPPGARLLRQDDPNPPSDLPAELIALPRSADPVVGGGTPTPTLPPGDPDGTYAYRVAGAASLNTLTRGNVGVSGLIDSRLDLDALSGRGRTDLYAQTRFDDSSATLKALGLLPVRATLGFSPAPRGGSSWDTVGVIEGNSTDGLRATISTWQTIRLRAASVFGIPLVFGERCRTAEPSQIDLSSTGGFSLITGGPLSGTFAIGDLTDCGFLTFLLSPLTAGDGNRIVLNPVPR